MDGAIGNPSVDDERAIRWSLAVESAGGGGFGAPGGSSVI
jgi:hypothetical protein